MKRAIITYCDRTNNYIHGLARLTESLRHNFDGELLAWVGHEALGSEPHEENPYNFKIHAFIKAMEAGYTSILWLDCSCYAVAPLEPIFDHIEKEGYIMQDAGHFAGEWSNDSVLKYFGMCRDEAMNIRMYGNAGFLGLDFTNETARSFFSEWENGMRKGLFKGAWTNTDNSESQDARCRGARHDMSVGSLIAYRLSMKLQSSQEWLQYAGPYVKLLNDKILIKAEGL